MPPSHPRWSRIVSGRRRSPRTGSSATPSTPLEPKAPTTGIALAVQGAIALLSLAAAANAQSTGQETFGRTTWWLPRSVSTYGHEIDTLFNVILYMTCGVGLAVFVLMGIFLVKYRHKPGRNAVFSHGNIRLEAVWTLLPTVILALTAAISQGVWARVKAPDRMPAGEDVVHIAVIGRQFAWYFHYPGKDGKLGPRRNALIPANATDPEQMVGLDRSHPDGKDDVVTPIMYVPVNTPVVMDLTSVDVLHSFFLPNMRVKQDAVPGLIGKIWFESTRTSAEVVGTNVDGSPKPFDIVCAELCGQGHFKMRGQMFVVTREEFDNFLETEYSYLGGGGF